ncbi:EAL domain-containing protein [Lysobacter sp. N42]|uniref:bifunctional diguanylate cyclase/phosphodiesterase n=1 Tax=Lysobacter sp. N42 TaxID=2545719 RepID=UPI001404F5C8|nr:EAL domain-containing protein [Lysobacter sp. N42]
MGGALSRQRLRHGAAAALASAFVAALCIAFTRTTGGVAEIWLANAVLAGWMLRAPAGVAPAVAAGGFLAMLTANRAFGSDWPVAVAFAAVNVVEALLVVLLLQRGGVDPRRPLDERAFALGTAIAVFGAPALAAGLGAGLLVWLDDAAWPGAFLRWWVSDSFGMLTVLPVAFAVHGPAVRRLLQPRQLLEFAGWLVLLLAMVAASFWVFSRVFVLVALPLLAIAFRYGQLPASLSNLAAALSLVALGSLAQTGRLGKVPHDALSSLEWGLYSAAMVIGPLMVSVSAERLRERGRELARHAEHQRVTLNAIGDAMVACDRDLRITEFNPAAEQMTGVTRAEAIGRHVEDVVRILNAATGRPMFSPLREAVASNRPSSLESEAALERDGAPPVPVEDSASPIIGPDGAVAGGIMVFRDVTEQRTLARQMAHLARHDALTGLPNRLLLRDRIEQELRGIPRGHAGCVMFLDLDRFKHINDTLGHAVGDEVLRTVAARLEGVVRDSDTVSRQGGDEFVLLCPGLVEDAEIAELVERLAAAVQEPQDVGGRALSIATSIGVARYPRDGDTVGELLRQADVALYHAKQSGRGRASLYARELNRSVAEVAELERELRHAVPGEELFLQYQPQYDMQSGAITGAEALVRWRRPDGQVAMPGEFLALAEETGVVGAIDRWVLDRACEECSHWVADGLRGARVSLNVSLAHLDAGQLVTSVRDALDRSGLPANCLEIEFTETHLLRAVDTAPAAIAQLRALGVALAIDDFGTGYSNLSQLSAHDFDVLKIDRSLVSRLPDDRRNVAVVQALIAMARALDCTLVAEGVETMAQADWLRGHGCGVAQGFLFDPPLDPARLRERLAVQTRGEPARA